MTQRDSYLAGAQSATVAVPRVGLLAAIRNRHGVVAAVQPFDGENGRLHLVHLEYKDARQPADERLLWERETGALLVEPTALPDPLRPAMPPADFDALLRAARWSALVPYLDPDGDGPLNRMPLASPFHGAVRVENYQLWPLLKALRMPRVSLLIADDVGLGKTVEAGLVLAELLLRRRIRRVLVLTPASLRAQWRDELKEKFALDFEVVDRQRTDAARRELGMDANPWRLFSRIVASYHYLRQPDVLQRFLAACQTPDGSPHLPWDLLIVDECHNLMPSAVGEDSGLCRMLRQVAAQFEHRLFLSATPHNGHTRSFTGLLEMLDPVRFTRTSEMTAAMRRRAEDVVVRRLKRDIDASTDARRFCRRNPPQAVALAIDARERELGAAFDAFRKTVRALAASGARGRQRAGHFAVEILGKRLLSCPTAFAESWRRARQGLAEAPADAAALAAAERAWRQETGDDFETEQRAATAAAVAGAWLANYAAEVQGDARRIEQALGALGFDLAGEAISEQTPRADARFNALAELIERLLLAGDAFLEDERLIVFTEYKTTLDYLARRLRARFDPQRVRTLFGAGGSGELAGMTAAEREGVKAAFNDPEAPVRILIATDAASEGLNLHRTARYLLHYDCPWNPSRLEQRNGRLDRYGQGRDVTVHHFVSDADDDLRFLAHVIAKADDIREDLGTVNELFDRAAHRRLIEGHDLAIVQAELDASLAERGGATDLPADATVAPEPAGAGDADESGGEVALEALRDEVDLQPQALRDTLEAALAATGGRPQLRSSGEADFHRLLRPDLPGWRDVVDASVRVGGEHGAVPQFAFSAEPFMHHIGDLRVFLPRHDALLMHLAHPLMRRALGVLARRRYPGELQVSRWTARHGAVPSGAEAVVLLSVEELAVNALRETFHCWVRDVAFPVRDGSLGEPLPHAWPRQHRGGDAVDAAATERAADILEDAHAHLRDWLAGHQRELTERLRRQLEADHDEARSREDERYRQRQGEVSALIEQSTLARLTREVDALAAKRQQGQLFDEAGQLAAIERSAEEKQQELARRRQHYDELREQLQRERARVLDHLLPQRFALAGTAQVFPVAVEVRLAG